jgi:hypothetical protein
MKVVIEQWHFFSAPSFKPSKVLVLNAAISSASE